MLLAERIESVKAGTIAAVSVFLVFAIATLGNQLFLAQRFESLATLQFSTIAKLVFSGAIACASGFLFGISYRYIIRQDRNSHLKDGAVLAFGLVRGLAQVDVGLNFANAFWSFATLGVESILLFAFARFTLDLAIELSWLKPFKSS